MRTRLLGALAALLLAAVGAVLIVSYVGGSEARAQAGMKTADAYVVETMIPAGTAGEALGGFLRMEAVPASLLAADAVTDLDAIAGTVTSIDLLPGDLLLSGRLVDPDSLVPAGTVPVPDGMQEVSVLLSPDRVVGGRLTAGDTVGIFASFETGDWATGSPTTHLLFHKVLVTSVQGALVPAEDAVPAGQPPAVPEGSVYVTLARTAPDAERIVFTAEFGSLWLSREADTASEDGTGIIDIEGIYR